MVIIDVLLGPTRRFRRRRIGPTNIGIVGNRLRALNLGAAEYRQVDVFGA